jgi:hypothetical protein
MENQPRQEKKPLFSAVFRYSQRLPMDACMPILPVMAKQPYRSSLKWLKGSEIPATRRCDVPGCREAGDHRAPRSRDNLNDYYWFCLEHVREYNQKWDFYAGMSAWDIENSQRSAHTWDRPTWRMGCNPHAERDLREKVMRDFGLNGGAYSEYQRAEQEKQWRREQRAAHSEAARAEIDALAVLDLEPPVEFEAIKARYKKLVKLHHPDANGGSAEAEEKLKTINEAYTVLKTAFSSLGERMEA